MPDERTLLQNLRDREGTIRDLRQAQALLAWDQNTYMPEGAAEARAQQIATLAGLAHGFQADPEFGALVEELEAVAFPADSIEAAMVRQARREFNIATRLPDELVRDLSRHAVRAQQIWARAREARDFAPFAPALEHMVDLKRKQADALGYQDHPYDALHDAYEPGSTAARVRSVFEPLRQATTSLVRRIQASGVQHDDAVLRQAFDETEQEAYALEVVTSFGYDLQHGRLDRTVHPFATAFSKYDVRITTRYQPDHLSPALFGTFHESGHGMYEQGIADEHYRTFLEVPASLGIHESQSRLWENLIGRSRSFWQGAYPGLQRRFASQLKQQGVETFYGAINRVEPSYIRVEADEVTYNLHIMLRFELELALIDGSLAVRDLPEAFDALMQEYLGITPPDAALGVLQDVHWATGLFGYFPTYALGNLMSVQLFEAAKSAISGLEDDVRAGDFGRLLGWLRDNVHVHGSRYLPDELLRRATGSDLDAGPYLRYLEAKFGDLYHLG